MKVDAGAAAAAIETGLAGELGATTTRAAWGIHEVVNENVARAFRVHASEHGVDVRRCTMVAFGGSGPLHAARVARKLKINQVVLPPAAGVMSALGLLISPLSFEVAMTRTTLWDHVDQKQWDEMFAILRQRAEEVLSEAGLSVAEMELHGRLDLRYAGQGYEVGVDVSLDRSSHKEVPSRFDAAYAAVFGITLADQQLEVVHWRLEARSPTGKQRAMQFASYSGQGNAEKAPRRAFDGETGGYLEHRVLDRYRLAPGQTFEGPALVEEMESTTVVGSGVRGHVDQQHNLILEIL